MIICMKLTIGFSQSRYQVQGCKVTWTGTRNIEIQFGVNFLIKINSGLMEMNQEFVLNLEKLQCIDLLNVDIYKTESNFRDLNTEERKLPKMITDPRDYLRIVQEKKPKNLQKQQILF